MPSTHQQQIETFAEISRQIHDEGAHEKIIALAEKLSKGQFGSPEADQNGAVMLVLDALAVMMARYPIRPECCVKCEFEYMVSRMQALGLDYKAAVAEIESGGRDGKA